MTKLEKIEADILSLSPAEQQQFAQWYANWRADELDSKIENDAKSGKLSALAEAALEEHKAGQTEPL